MEGGGEMQGIKDKAKAKSAAGSRQKRREIITRPYDC